MPVTVEHSVGRVRVLLEQKYTKNASPHVRDHIYKRSIEKEHIFLFHKDENRNVANVSKQK